VVKREEILQYEKLKSYMRHGEKDVTEIDCELRRFYGLEKEVRAKGWYSL